MRPSPNRQWPLTGPVERSLTPEVTLSIHLPLLEHLLRVLPELFQFMRLQVVVVVELQVALDMQAAVVVEVVLSIVLPIL